MQRQRARLQGEGRRGVKRSRRARRQARRSRRCARSTCRATSSGVPAARRRVVTGCLATVTRPRESPLAAIGVFFPPTDLLKLAGENVDLRADNGVIDLTDPVRMLEYLFLGGATPPAPFPDRGPDPTADDLDCLRA